MLECYEILIILASSSGKVTYIYQKKGAMGNGQWELGILSFLDFGKECILGGLLPPLWLTRGRASKS
jgi:hypothetical protein